MTGNAERRASFAKSIIFSIKHENRALCVNNKRGLRIYIYLSQLKISGISCSDKYFAKFFVWIFLM